MTSRTLTKIETINLENEINKLRKLEGYIFHIGEKFNYKAPSLVETNHSMDLKISIHAMVITIQKGYNHPWNTIKL